MSVKTNLQFLVSRYNQIALSHSPQREEIESSDSCLVISPTSADGTTSRVNKLLQSHFQNTRGDVRKAAVLFVMQSSSSSDLLQKKYITNLIKLASRENDVVLQPLHDKEDLEKELSTFGISWPFLDSAEDSIDIPSITKNLAIRGWIDRSLYHISLDDLYLEDNRLWKECIQLSQKVASAIGMQLENLSALPRREHVKEILKITQQGLDYVEPDLKSNFIVNHDMSMILKDIKQLLANVKKASDLIETSLEINKVLTKQLEKTLESFPGKRVFVIVPSFCMDGIVEKLDSTHFFSTEYTAVKTKSKL
jgi:hypothetical protein